MEHFTLSRLRGIICCEHHDRMNRTQLKGWKITQSLSPGPKKRGFGTCINKHARASHIQIKTAKSASLRDFINPLNPELNPICYLLALLGAHHFLHVSRIRVKLLTLRRLISYIYGAPILDVSRSHTTTHHSR